MSTYKCPDYGCVKNIQVYGLDESMIRAKYPMAVDTNVLTSDITPRIQKLATAEKGAGHDQFLTGIVVQFDLTFTVKAWTEAERYHFFDFVSSQSTMHRITQFDVDKQYIKYVDPKIINIIKKKIDKYNQLLEIMSKDQLKEMYLEILYSNPAGFQLTAGMTTNYRQLKTIYAQRKDHRLPEWREFCKWIETLPHSEFITGKEKQPEGEL